MKNNIHSDSRSNSIFAYFCTAMVLGSLWGFFEVFFKDVLGMGGKPFASAIMTGIGIAVMSTGYGLYKKHGVFITVTVFTIITRMLVVPVLGCSPICRANSVVALLLLGSSVTLAFGIHERLMNGNMAIGGLVAGSGVIISGMVFYYAGMVCAPCPYLLTYSVPGGFAAFIKTEVLYWAFFSTISFYPGYILGNSIRSTLSYLHSSRPGLYYTGIISASFAMMICTGLILTVH